MIRERRAKKENTGVKVSAIGPLRPYPDGTSADSYLGICGAQNCGNVVSFQVNSGVTSKETTCTKCGATNTQ